MGYQAGIVANHRELMTELYDFLVAEGWTSLMYENTKDATTGEPFGSNCQQAVLQNTGISGTEVVIIGLRCWEYSAGAAYGLDLNGYITWTAGQLWNGNSGDTQLTTYDATWGRFSSHPQLPLMNSNMPYWFICNDQRVVVIVKTSSYYQSAYLGFGNRLGNPGQYPYPLLVIGSAYGNIAYTDTSAAHSYIIAPYITSARGTIICVDPSNIYSTAKTSMGSLTLHPTDPSMGGFIRGEWATEHKLLLPVYVSMDNQLLLSFDDVYRSWADNMNSEDIIVHGAENHLVVQNNHRVTYKDFMIVNLGTTATTTSSTTTTTTTAP